MHRRPHLGPPFRRNSRSRFGCGTGRTLGEYGEISHRVSPGSKRTYSGRARTRWNAPKLAIYLNRGRRFRATSVVSTIASIVALNGRRRDRSLPGLPPKCTATNARPLTTHAIREFTAFVREGLPPQERVGADLPGRGKFRVTLIRQREIRSNNGRDGTGNKNWRRCSGNVSHQAPDPFSSKSESTAATNSATRASYSAVRSLISFAQPRGRWQAWGRQSESPRLASLSV